MIFDSKITPRFFKAIFGRTGIVDIDFFWYEQEDLGV